MVPRVDDAAADMFPWRQDDGSAEARDDNHNR